MRFLFTCGGTAGHVNPAVAVAGRLRELMPDCEILFAGAEGKMEMQLVPREGYEIRPLPVTNISRGHSAEALLHNIKTLENVAVSMHQTDRILREFKPDVVIGTGGYVCYPVLRQAAKRHIPTLVHESNAVPGLTTKLLDGHIDRIMVGFEESRAHYKDPERVVVTGTPVRGEFAKYTKETAREQLGLPKDEPLVVSVWGSLGAGHMNGVIGEMIPLLRETRDFRLVHSIGSGYYKDFMARLRETAPDCAEYGVDVREYIYDMPRVMAAADLILCRAGASTLAELTYIGKPVVLVPSPNVTNNHQEKNARVLEKAGGAKVLLEGEFDAASLLETVRGLLGDPEQLKAMSRAMAGLGVPNATDRIVEEILELI
ncbi:MAG: UDP-N-acetylglucosamine--N-acetylmuramyl-(pentapeptide) pyrophosphoryl-undecaprenol N-acetylglucosamine transferase [Oscillospiraceae bacterium]|nr:UDP-N-acetylglucosamine--N-acetylmuramyl-(pentapeptide) pyrophosphoryl-undecaprenol N-acetylglucosamine transferase [Oscillospiraceae bacterium]